MIQVESTKAVLIKTSAITAVTVMVCFIVSFLSLSSEQYAYGETNEIPALEVYYDDELLKGFSMKELDSIAIQEGLAGKPEKRTYSGYSTFPTRITVKNAEGPTVSGILNEALKKKEKTIGDLAGDQILKFESGDDGVKEYFLVSQLFAERYCFPREDSATGEYKVPPIISLKEDDKTYDNGANPEVGRLLFGQTNFNEQNHAAYVKGMATQYQKDADEYKLEKPGKINIYSTGKKPTVSWTDTWNPIIDTDHGSGGKVEPETELTFDRGVNIFPRGGGPRYWIHYTIDGTEPDGDDEMYNWNNFYFGRPGEQFTKPVVDEGPITIKVKVIGYGKKDSEVTTFSFTGEKTLPPAAPARVSGKATGYQSIRVSWNKVGDADGYQIFRSQAKSTGFTHIYTANSGSQVTFNNSSSSVKTGTTYYYRVRAFKVNNNGVTLYSGFSPVVSAKTYLNRPKIKSIKAKGKKITLRWTRVPGATGYKIYRATKKKGKYALIKTVRGNGKVSMVNKKPKKKKTYWYKVRAYRTVAGKNVYSSFSNIKYRKIK